MYRVGLTFSAYVLSSVSILYVLRVAYRGSCSKGGQPRGSEQDADVRSPRCGEGGQADARTSNEQ
eukprot:8333728-Pyramimonas_sp.AAC.1